MKSHYEESVRSHYEKSVKSHYEALIAAIAVMDAAASVDPDMNSAYPRQIEYLLQQFAW